MQPRAGAPPPARARGTMNIDVEFHIRHNYPWSKLPANVRQVRPPCGAGPRRAVTCWLRPRGQGRLLSPASRPFPPPGSRDGEGRLGGRRGSLGRGWELWAGSRSALAGPFCLEPPRPQASGEAPAQRTERADPQRALQGAGQRRGPPSPLQVTAALPRLWLSRVHAHGGGGEAVPGVSRACAREASGGAFGTGESGDGGFRGLGHALSERSRRPPAPGARGGVPACAGLAKQSHILQGLCTFFFFFYFILMARWVYKRRF